MLKPALSLRWLRWVLLALYLGLILSLPALLYLTLEERLPLRCWF